MRYSERSWRRNYIKHPEAKEAAVPYDYVLIFKLLILQRYYNFSDDQIEFHGNDRMSFMSSLGPTIADNIPDSSFVWNFKEQLADTCAVEALKKTWVYCK